MQLKNFFVNFLKFVKLLSYKPFENPNDLLDKKYSPLREQGAFFSYSVVKDVFLFFTYYLQPYVASRHNRRYL